MIFLEELELLGRGFCGDTVGQGRHEDGERHDVLFRGFHSTLSCHKSEPMIKQLRLISFR
jgi:hypothetical protein